jgi:hypothetical protein
MTSERIYLRLEGVPSTNIAEDGSLVLKSLQRAVRVHRSSADLFTDHGLKLARESSSGMYR